MSRLFRHTNWFRQHKPWIIFAIAVLFIIAVCLLFVYFMKEQPWGMEKRGQFGDMFGVLGAVFSGLAFAGLIVTLIQQHDDLKLQREDLRLQRQEIAQTNLELALQRKEMEEQNKTIMLQRFETTFFNMLKSQVEIRNSVKYDEYEGKDAIVFLFRYYVSAYKNKAKINGYDIFLNQFLDQYFRHIIQTLKMIDTADFLSTKEKYYYSEILSSHMTLYELGVFFYYCLTDEGKSTAKGLVEKYALFVSLNNEESFPKDELSLFSNGAFSQKVDDESIPPPKYVRNV